MNILVVEWIDSVYSKRLATKKEIMGAVAPEKVLTVGFEVTKRTDTLVIAQSYDATNNIFINTNLIPLTNVITRDTLKKAGSAKENLQSYSLAIIKWETEDDYRDAVFSKEDSKSLHPREIISVGYINQQDSNIALFGEKIKEKKEYRTELKIQHTSVNKIHSLVIK